MSGFKRVFHFLIDSNLYIALCAALFYWTGLMLFQNSIVEPELVRFATVFLSALLIYNITNPVSGWSTTQKRISGGLISLLLLIVAFFLSYREVLFLGHLGVLAFFYNPGPVKIGKLREIPYLKIIFIAYIWASLISTYPAINSSESLFSSFAIRMLIGHFFFIVGITLPFDIRDFSPDLNKNVKTIPGKIGIRNTKIIALISLCFYFLIVSTALTNVFPVLLIMIISLFLVLFSEPSNSRWYFTGAIDGLFILYFLLIYLSL